MSELDPARHIHMQRNIPAGYSISSIAKGEPSVDEAIKLMIRQLDDCADTKTIIDFGEWYLYFTFDVIGRVTFSKPFRLLQEGQDIGNAIAIGEYLESVSGRMADKEAQDDMMEHWMATWRKHPHRMGETEIQCAALVNLGAGAGSVGAVLQAFTQRIAASPDRYRRLREELDGAASRDELDAIPSWVQVHKLPYLRIKETVRVHTSFQIGMPRVVPKGGLTIGNRKFKEGTVLSVPAWTLHHDPAIWGGDADQWVPERWLDSYELIPFGQGYNQCPGQQLAYFEMSKLLAAMIRNYDLELVTKKWVDSGNFLAMAQSCCKCLVKKRVDGGELYH
ncbi:hypothetical protein MMC30_005407 [Trapelia coarctata]|nr:hypothetical protein [Trapelia coarctata]